MKYLILALSLLPFISDAQLAIKAARTVHINTNEGSYINVDITPDGKMMAFDLLGELFIMPVSGGKAKQVTKGLALNLRPVFSPNGDKIAYISDATGDFAVHALDLKHPKADQLLKYGGKVSTGINPVWSADGQLIFNGNEVYRYKGKAISPIIREGQVLRCIAGSDEYFYSKNVQVFRSNSKTRSGIAITPTLPGEPVAISPNGQWVFYFSNQDRSLNSYDVVKKKYKLIIAGDQLVNKRYPASVDLPHFGISSDSRFLYISYQGKIHRINHISGEDKIIEFDASVEVKMGKRHQFTYRVKQEDFHVKYFRFPVKRPGGKSFLICALNRIYQVEEGKSPKVLVDQDLPQFEPVYSPDGQSIAYVTWSEKTGGGLWRIAAEGGEPECLLKSELQLHKPQWRPDGKMIAFTCGKPLKKRDDNGEGGLFLFTLADKKNSLVDSNAVLNGSISFSNDGSLVYFQPVSSIDSKYPPMIKSVDLRSKHRETVAVAKQRWGLNYCKIGRLSPDGRFIVYSFAEDLYLSPVSDTGVTCLYDPQKPLPIIRIPNGVDPSWSEDGELIWVYGNSIYRSFPELLFKAAKSEQQSPFAKELHEFPELNKYKPKQFSIDVTSVYLKNKGNYALTDVRIIPMENAQVIDQGFIWIEQGRIKMIGSMSDRSLPEDITKIPMNGKTIMPGLIDIHLHIGIPSDLLSDQFWMMEANLAYGVTTARDPSSSYDGFGYSELIKAGMIKGPRFFPVGRAVNPTMLYTNWQSLEYAKGIVRKRKIMGAISVKQYTMPSRLQKQRLLLACDSYGINMTNEGTSGPIGQIGMLKDGSPGIEHFPAWGTLYNDIASLVSQSGTYMTATLQVPYGSEYAKAYMNWKFWHKPDAKLLKYSHSDPEGGPTSNGPESIETIIKSMPTDTLNPLFLEPARIHARLFKSGAKLALGSHGNNPGTGVHNELWSIQLGGLSNMESLEVATINGARALGVDKDLGSLKAGKIADLLILNKNPLDDIHNSREIQYVVKDGIMYDGDTLKIINKE